MQKRAEAIPQPIPFRSSPKRARRLKARHGIFDLAANSFRKRHLSKSWPIHRILTSDQASSGAHDTGTTHRAAKTGVRLPLPLPAMSPAFRNPSGSVCSQPRAGQFDDVRRRLAAYDFPRPGIKRRTFFYLVEVDDAFSGVASPKKADRVVAMWLLGI
jgi:hypothetical protein